MLAIGRCLNVEHVLDSLCHCVLIFPLHRSFFLIVRLSPLPILFSGLNSCSTSNVPFGYCFCQVAFIVFSFDLFTVTEISSVYMPKVPWASLHPGSTPLHGGYPLIDTFLPPDSKFLSPCLMHTCFSSISVLEAQASYEMLAEMIDVFEESKEGKQRKQRHLRFFERSPCCRCCVGC